MKKTIGFLSLFFVALCANATTLKDFNNIAPIKESGINIVEYADLGDLYILTGIRSTKNGDKPISLTVSKDLKYTFFGKAFDNKTKERLYIKKDVAAYKSKASFTFGTGKDEYFLFTDPECPYCVNFEKRLAEVNIEDKVKIYYFLYPMPFHKEAKAMCMYTLTQKDNASKLKVYHGVVLKGSQDYKTKNYSKSELENSERQLKDAQEIGLKIVVSGTPTLLAPDGQRLKVNRFLNKATK